MTYRPLGNSGLMVSTVGLGTNAFGSRIDAEQTRAVVDAAIDAGITLFDTSDTYGLGASEELLGRALGKRRDDVVLATKFGMDMGGANGPDWGARASRRYVRRAVEASLRRLGTDHIDLYQLHQPDLVTPIEETLEALTELVTEGKVRYVGCSNFAAWEVVDAHWTAVSAGLRPFVSAQNEYSLYNRAAEEELLPALSRLGDEPDRLLPAGLRPADREVPPRRAGPGRQPARRGQPGAPAGERRLGPDRGAARLRRRARRRHPRRRARRARRAAVGRQRDRRRDPARAGRGQRAGRAVGADRARTWTRSPRSTPDRGPGMTHASFTRR